MPRERRETGMKGDYYDVTIKVGGTMGVVKQRVQAKTDGASVSLDQGKANDRFLEIEVLNKASKPIETAIFSKDDVSFIVSGHESIARKTVKKTKA
jgi:hypothetical protein